MKAYLLAHMIWNGTGAELASVGVYSEDEGSICNDYSRGFYARLGTYEGANFGDARQAAVDDLRDPKGPLRNLRPFAPQLFGDDFPRTSHGHVQLNALADSARVAIHEVLSGKVARLMHDLEKETRRLRVEDEAARQRMASALRVETWPKVQLASWATLELAARGATDRALAVGAHVRANPPVADGIAAATKLEGTGFDRDLREPDVGAAFLASIWSEARYWTVHCGRLALTLYGRTRDVALVNLGQTIQALSGDKETAITITDIVGTEAYVQVSANKPAALLKIEYHRMPEVTPADRLRRTALRELLSSMGVSV